MAYVTPDFRMTRAMLCADGRTVLIWFSLPATIGAGGSGGFSIYNGETSVSDLTYLAGDAGIVFVFHVDTWFEPVDGLTVRYTQPGNGVETITGADLPTSTVGLNEEYVVPTLPVLFSATVDTTGSILTLVFDRPMAQGTGYLDADFNLDGSIGGTDIGVTYTSGDGTDTHVYAISATIRLGETVNLDYNGRPDGLGDPSGNDLGTVLNFAVVNISTEDYSDIVYWDGLEGTLTNTTYESTNYDWPEFHTAVVSANVSPSTAIKKVGAKSLRISGGSFSFTSNIPVTSAAAGRAGCWLRLDTDIHGGFKTFLRLRGTSDGNRLTLTRVNENQLIVDCANNGVNIINGVYLTPLFNMTANTWFFLEMIWDFENYGVRLNFNGEDDAQAVIPVIANTVYDFNTLVLNVANYYGYIDNLIISTDPNRDLYALALLEAYPGS